MRGGKEFSRLIKLLKERKDLTSSQKEKIMWHYSSGLSMEQLSVYFDPKFTFEQADEIVQAYREGLSDKEVSILKNPELNPEQIRQLRRGLKKIGVNKIKPFAIPQYSPQLLEVIITGFTYGLSSEEIKTLITPSTPPDEAQKILYYYLAKKQGVKPEPSIDFEQLVDKIKEKRLEQRLQIAVLFEFIIVIISAIYVNTVYDTNILGAIVKIKNDFPSVKSLIGSLLLLSAFIGLLIVYLLLLEPSYREFRKLGFRLPLIDEIIEKHRDD